MSTIKDGSGVKNNLKPCPSKRVKRYPFSSPKAISAANNFT
jgi:hypothetical protein